jgi:hypothetical protein
VTIRLRASGPLATWPPKRRRVSVRSRCLRAAGPRELSNAGPRELGNMGPRELGNMGPRELGNTGPRELSDAVCAAVDCTNTGQGLAEQTEEEVVATGQVTPAGAIGPRLGAVAARAAAGVTLSVCEPAPAT